MSIGSFGASSRAITLPEVAAGLCDIAIPRTTLPNCRATYTASMVVPRVTRELAVMAAPFVFIVAQFLAFARAGSMQAGAKALRVHQSTIQRRIAELEESLGRRLVEPHGGGYRLTELRQELQSTPGLGCRPGLSLLSSLRAPLVL